MYKCEEEQIKDIKEELGNLGFFPLAPGFTKGTFPEVSAAEHENLVNLINTLINNAFDSGFESGQNNILGNINR